MSDRYEIPGNTYNSDFKFHIKLAGVPPHVRTPRGNTPSFIGFTLLPEVFVQFNSLEELKQKMAEWEVLQSDHRRNIALGNEVLASAAYYQHWATSVLAYLDRMMPYFEVLLESRTGLHPTFAPAVLKWGIPTPPVRHQYVLSNMLGWDTNSPDKLLNIAVCDLPQLQGTRTKLFELGKQERKRIASLGVIQAKETIELLDWIKEFLTTTEFLRPCDQPPRAYEELDYSLPEPYLTIERASQVFDFVPLKHWEKISPDQVLIRLRDNGPVEWLRLMDPGVVMSKSTALAIHRDGAGWFQVYTVYEVTEKKAVLRTTYGQENFLYTLRLSFPFVQPGLVGPDGANPHKFTADMLLR